MNTPPESKPVPVPLTAQQGEKVAALRAMAAPEVQTALRRVIEPIEATFAEQSYGFLSIPSSGGRSALRS